MNIDVQPAEQNDEIFVLVVDETYDSGDTWAEDSENYRLQIQKEFGVDFKEANIGPGADLPAFLTVLTTTTIPLWSLILAMFFLGKPIKENLEAWYEIGKRIRQFFKRPIYLSRNGCAVIAVEAVFAEIVRTPKSLRLRSYRVNHVGGELLLEEFKSSRKVDAAPPTLNLGFIQHVFEIEADDMIFRVRVDGTATETIRLR
ncbi:MAG: hypothetical protein ACKVP5_05945 [Aestuariivirga sp.]